MTDTTGVKGVTDAMRDAFYEATTVTREGTIHNLDAGLIAALAAQPSAGAQGEAVAWRWRYGEDWYAGTAEPTFKGGERVADEVRALADRDAAQPDTDDVRSAVEIIDAHVRNIDSDTDAAWALIRSAISPDTGDVAALREGWVTIPDNTGDMILNGMVGALDCLDEIASAAWSGEDAVERIQVFARREHDYALAALSKPNAQGREG